MEIVIDKKEKLPIYIQIYKQIKHSILNGKLPPGTLLPPERKLALSLTVNRSTVLNAYNRLKEEGLIESKVGQGTIVSSLKEVPAEIEEPSWSQLFNAKLEDLGNDMLGKMFTHLGNRNILSFALGMADPNCIPDFSAYKLDSLLQSNPSLLSQTPVAGDISLRENISKLLSKRNILCPPEELIVLSGSQQGIDIISRIFIQPGDVVFAESPTYFLALQSFKRAGAKIVEIPLDYNGIKTEQVERLLKRYHPKCIYTVPDYQNPSSCCMSLERRKQLVKLAGRHDFIILEDGAYAGLGFEGTELPSMYELDGKGHVVYLGTFSKTMCSGLRLGYMAAHRNIIAMACMARQSMDIHPNSLSQYLVNEFLKSGDYDAHLQALRNHYSDKMNLMYNLLLRHAPTGILEESDNSLKTNISRSNISKGDILKSNILKSMEFFKPMGGYYIWCMLPEGVKASELLNLCINEGIVFMPGKPFFQYEDNDSFIRINYTVPTKEDIEKGIPIICSNIKKLMNAAPQKYSISSIPPSSYLPVF